MNEENSQSPIPAGMSGKGHEPNHVKTCLGITKELRFCRKPKTGRFYCHVHKRQPLHFLVAASLAIVFGYVAALIPLPWKTPRQQPPIVSPALVRLHTNDSAVHTLVEVRNPNDFPVYSVYLQLLSKDVSSESIKVEMDKGDPLLEIAAGESLKVSQDTIRIDGTIPSMGDVVILRIFAIPSKESKRFMVFGTQPVDSSASLSIESWQKTPDEMFSGP